MDNWREDFNSAQLRELGTVLFGHCKCDVCLRVQVIAHFAMCVPFGFLIPANVMTLRYILHLLSMFMVRVFLSTSIEVVHEEQVALSDYRWDPCSTNVKRCINAIEEFPKVCDACIPNIKKR